VEQAAETLVGKGEETVAAAKEQRAVVAVVAVVVVVIRKIMRARIGVGMAVNPVMIAG
jgi:hypothetical protein